jgi:peptide/nickel transport system ATP-binding protein
MNSAPNNPGSILEVRDLVTAFDGDAGRVTAVDGVSFDVPRGKTLGIVGESGCGKSVTAFSITRLLPQPHGKVLGGSIRFEGRDLLQASQEEMQHLRGNDISMIFQEPMTALNPVQTVGRQLTESIMLHERVSAQESLKRCIEMLNKVRIPAPETRLHEYAHQLSGGMRQRVMIAMALINTPKLLIADEPTTALDVTVQAQILQLIKDMQQELGMSLILITHDLGVIAETCDEVAVMYAGRIVERASVHELFSNPRHAYTRGLLASIPRLDSTPKTRLPAIPGNVPSIETLKPGCRFAERSGREHTPEQISTRPGFVEISPLHWVEGCPVCTGMEIAKPQADSYHQQHEQQSGTNPSGTLEAALAHLVRGSGADRTPSGREGWDAERHRQLDSVAGWAKNAGKLIPADRWTTPEELGAEHRVFFDEARSCAIKVTNNGRCGMTYRQGEPEPATAVEYLERWLLHNKLFADTVWFEGVVETPAGYSLAVGQVWIEGDVPAVEDVESFMRTLGFDTTALPECYYRAADDMAVMDCHTGNFISGRDGIMYAIDVIPVKADAALKRRMEVAS